MNALDAGKVSADDVSGLSGTVGSLNTALANHINSTNPHPNYSPSWSDLTNRPGLGDISGTLDVSKVDGLTEAIDDRIALSSNGGSGYGITDYTLADGGHVTFGNGLMIQWGRVFLSADDFNSSNRFNKVRTITFSTEFPHKCYVVTIGTEFNATSTGNQDSIIQTRNITTTGFDYVVQEFYNGSNIWSSINCNYIAIGN